MDRRLTWFGMWTSGGLLWTRRRTFEFRKIRGISSLAGELLHVQGLYSMELVITLVRLWGIRWTEHVESVKYVRHEYTFFNRKTRRENST